jgi:hypothetical protein
VHGHGEEVLRRRHLPRPELVQLFVVLVQAQLKEFPPEIKPWTSVRILKIFSPKIWRNNIFTIVFAEINADLCKKWIITLDYKKNTDLFAES